MVLIDLHTHSTASDGTQAPAELVAAARDAGVDVLAITDHDTTGGWAEAADAARRLDVVLVRGIEVSCRHEGISIHLLGYLQDPTSPGLVAELDKARQSRQTRAQRIVERLAEELPITYEEVLSGVAPGATIGRPHIADALVAKGMVPSRDVAFAKYLHSRSRYVTHHYAPDPVTAVELVGRAGGVSVMAHPFAHARGRVVGDEVIAAMADAGLAGLEVHHRDHDAAAVAHGRELAARLNLLVTGSSDYHGTGKANRLGENSTEESVLRRIEERAAGVPVVRR